MPSIQFRITNIHCDACVKISNSALKDLQGVTNVEVDAKNGNTKVESDREISFQEITQALSEVDKTAEILP